MSGKKIDDVRRTQVAQASERQRQPRLQAEALCLRALTAASHTRNTSPAASAGSLATAASRWLCAALPRAHVCAGERAPAVMAQQRAPPP